MYGGTCINIGCIPTKTLLVAAEKDLSFEEVIATKIRSLVASTVKTMLLLQVQVWISLMRKLTFKQSHRNPSWWWKQELTAETIVINTGAVSNVLPIPGLATSKNVFDSWTSTWTNCLKTWCPWWRKHWSWICWPLQQTWKQGGSSRCLRYFPTSSRTFHRSSC